MASLRAEPLRIGPSSRFDTTYPPGSGSEIDYYTRIAQVYFPGAVNPHLRWLRDPSPTALGTATRAILELVDGGCPGEDFNKVFAIAYCEIPGNTLQGHLSHIHLVRLRVRRMQLSGSGLPEYIEDHIFRLLVEFTNLPSLQVVILEIPGRLVPDWLETVVRNLDWALEWEDARYGLLINCTRGSRLTSSSTDDPVAVQDDTSEVLDKAGSNEKEKE